ncbi:MAG: hypothetical protein GKS00_02115 [Alphaproteobacteria bacterium]|nr:hypothetical protein [Alphaproteobacteria bacterium]
MTNCLTAGTGRGPVLAAILAAGLCAATAAQRNDGERIDHYAAREAANLKEAVTNFSAFNDKVAEILARPELGPNDLEEVHELTYTLESALAEIRTELSGLADTLEALHLASEAHKAEATRTHGAAYLETARALVP